MIDYTNDFDMSLAMQKVLLEIMPGLKETVYYMHSGIMDQLLDLFHDAASANNPEELQKILDKYQYLDLSEWGIKRTSL